MKKLLPSEKLKIKQGQFFVGVKVKSFKDLANAVYNPNRGSVGKVIVFLCCIGYASIKLLEAF